MWASIGESLPFALGPASASFVIIAGVVLLLGRGLSATG